MVTDRVVHDPFCEWFVLQYSLDDGSTWTTIVENVGCSETYPWLVPVVTSPRARMRIIETNDSFSIVEIVATELRTWGALKSRYSN